MSGICGKNTATCIRSDARAPVLTAGVVARHFFSRLWCSAPTQAQQEAQPAAVHPVVDAGFAFLLSSRPGCATRFQARFRPDDRLRNQRLDAEEALRGGGVRNGSVSATYSAIPLIPSPSLSVVAFIVTRLPAWRYSHASGIPSPSVIRACVQRVRLHERNGVAQADPGDVRAVDVPAEVACSVVVDFLLPGEIRPCVSSRLYLGRSRRPFIQL
jgi:hypothetical protein